MTAIGPKECPHENVMTVSCEIEYVGIDVSKSDLVLAIHGENRIETFPNTPVGVARLCASSPPPWPAPRAF